jgi:hypothetical protein
MQCEAEPKVKIVTLDDVLTYGSKTSIQLADALSFIGGGAESCVDLAIPLAQRLKHTVKLAERLGVMA